MKAQRLLIGLTLVNLALSVLPAKTQPDGVTYPETVLLRLITERGRPSVKISSSEESATVGRRCGQVPALAFAPCSRGSSAGFTYVMAKGPIALTATIVLPFAIPK
jgi:hypothetical protein